MANSDSHNITPPPNPDLPTGYDDPWEDDAGLAILGPQPGDPDEEAPVRIRHSPVSAGSRNIEPAAPPQAATAAEPASSAVRARTPSMLRDPRNWGPAGLAAWATIKFSGLREPGMAARALNLLPEKARRDLAMANIGAVATLAFGITATVVKPVVGAILAAKGYTAPPSGAVGPNVAGSLSDIVSAANDTLPGPSNDTANLTPVSQHLPEVEFSAGAKRIGVGEGWYHQLREMGFENQDDMKTYLQDHGAELQERGLAYKTGNSWGINLGNSNNKPSSFSAEDLQFMHDLAVEDGLLPSGEPAAPIDQQPADQTEQNQPQTGQAPGGDQGQVPATPNPTTSPIPEQSSSATGENAGHEPHQQETPQPAQNVLSDEVVAGSSFVFGAGFMGVGALVGRNAVKQARQHGLHTETSARMQAQLALAEQEPTAHTTEFQTRAWKALKNKKRDLQQLTPKEAHELRVTALSKKLARDMGRTWEKLSLYDQLLLRERVVQQERETGELGSVKPTTTA
jgi:hypothetical protein